MVALLSLRLSKEGGLSSWSSSVSVHNELLRLGRKVATEHLAPSSPIRGGAHQTASKSYPRLVGFERALPCMPIQRCELGITAPLKEGPHISTESFGCAAQDLVEELVAPHWYVDRKGETPPGKKEFYKQPIFNYHQVLHLVHG